MTRQETFKRFAVCADGTIAEGAFEGEPLYAPHFYLAVLAGKCSEDVGLDGKPEYAVDVTAADRAEYPEIPADAATMLLTVSIDSVECRPMSADAWEAHVNALFAADKAANA